MKNAPDTLSVLLVAAVLLAACQSTPSDDKPAAPASDSKPAVYPAVTPPPPTPAAPPKAEAMPVPEARTEIMSVAEMQKRLTELGYQPGAPDGVAGKRTTDALKKFQQANRLPATGTLDGETIRRLRSAKR